MGSRHERKMIDALQAGKASAWRELFDQHYAVLCKAAAQWVGDDCAAESIVSDVMVKVWNIRTRLDVHGSLRAYLMRAVRNACINYLSSMRVRNERAVLDEDIANAEKFMEVADSDGPLGQLLYRELEGEVRKVISRMPIETRQVFRMSPFDGLANAEIAKLLGISVNTVKYHNRRALQFLREGLAPYLDKAGRLGMDRSSLMSLLLLLCLG